MAEILGLGVTHWPTLCMPNEGLTGVFKTTLRAPNVEATRKDPANWPAGLIAEQHRAETEQWERAWRR